MLSVKEQIKIICKGVETLVNESELEKKLERSYKNNEALIIKLGLDPSAPDIHLGHTVVLRKIKQMQDLGHKAVIVIGDFTGRIGDPTGKSKGRAALSDEQVKENAATYCEQIFKVIDKEKTEVRFNSEWLAKLNFEDVLKLTSVTTVARILERDDFKKRYKNQTSIGIHEFLYPLMQAYDSFELKADIELGGTDQTFNILMGRTLQKAFGQEEQIAMFMPILEGLDGIEKMSKSLGNYIGINESPQIMFKKVMEIPDSLIIRYFELATDEHSDKIEQIRKRLESGENPKNIKIELAKIITQLYHGNEEMKRAKEYFETAFTKKQIPENIPEMIVDWEADTINDIIPSLIKLKYVTSKSEFIRLSEQGGIKLNDEKIQKEDMSRVLVNEDILKIGKKRFIKLVK